MSGWEYIDIFLCVLVWKCPPCLHPHSIYIEPLRLQGAAYAIGNASYHSGQLYPRLKSAIPALVELLRDPQTKTRANAASM